MYYTINKLMCKKNEINNDLLYFKNDILLDIRKVEERLNFKLTEQSVINSEQFVSFEKNYINYLKE